MTAESILDSIRKAEQMAKEMKLATGPAPNLAGIVLYLREARFKSEAYLFDLLRTVSPYDRCDVEVAGRQWLKQMDDLILKAEGASLRRFFFPTATESL
jgi:hypothetical protein